MKVNPQLYKIARSYDALSETELKKISKIQVKQQAKLTKSALKPSNLKKMPMNDLATFEKQMQGKVSFSAKRVIVSFLKLFKDKDMQKIYANMEAQSKNPGQPLKLGQQNKADLRRITRQKPEINEHLKTIRDNLKNPQTQKFVSPLFTFSQKMAEQIQKKSTLDKVLEVLNPKPKLLKELENFNSKVNMELNKNPMEGIIEALNSVIKK